MLQVPKVGVMVKECINADLQQQPCYRYGEAGLVVAECKKSPSCPICRNIEGQPSATYYVGMVAAEMPQ